MKLDDKIKMKNCNIILTKNLHKYKHCHQVKSII